MVDILLKVIIGVVAGAAAVGTAAAVYEIISRSNIVEKIKEAVRKKKANKDKEKTPFEKIVEEAQKNSESVESFFGVNNTTEDKETDPFAAVIKEVQKKSVSVDVIFNTAEGTKHEEYTLYADEVADDIKEGELISLVD